MTPAAWSTGTNMLNNQPVAIKFVRDRHLFDNQVLSERYADVPRGYRSLASLKHLSCVMSIGRIGR